MNINRRMNKSRGISTKVTGIYGLCSINALINMETYIRRNLRIFRRLFRLQTNNTVNSARVRLMKPRNTRNNILRNKETSLAIHRRVSNFVRQTSTNKARISISRFTFRVTRDSPITRQRKLIRRGCSTKGRITNTFLYNRQSNRAGRANANSGTTSKGTRFLYRHYRTRRSRRRLMNNIRRETRYFIETSLQTTKDRRRINRVQYHVRTFTSRRNRSGTRTSRRRLNGTKGNPKRKDYHRVCTGHDTRTLSKCHGTTRRSKDTIGMPLTNRRYQGTPFTRPTTCRPYNGRGRRHTPYTHDRYGPTLRRRETGLGQGVAGEGSRSGLLGFVQPVCSAVPRPPKRRLARGNT